MTKALNVLGVALVTVLASSLVAAPASAKSQAETNATPVAIPSGGPPGPATTFGSAVSEVKVKKLGTVNKVTAAVQIAHPRTFDLDLYLLHRGTFVLLASGIANGTSTANMGSGTACTGGMTLFDNKAPLFLKQGTNPFDGSFIPSDSLSAFRGELLKGKWRLVVLNQSGPQSSVGTINCFELDVKYEPKPKQRDR
jgi:subtilisin-like proprotein convertase family protein